MAHHAELISGTCDRLLFNPKGGIEGVLVKVQGAVVQVTLGPDAGGETMRTKGRGKRLRVLAMADRSPKARGAPHPVYRFESFADASGKPVAHDASHLTTITGQVTALHYARHGEPNGVILDGGEFIHVRPKGMAQLGLEVGSRIRAEGQARETVLGTRMLEARSVNRVVLA